MKIPDRIVPLVEIFASFPFLFKPVNIPNISIYGITADSRKVKPGYVFVACPGQSVDGHSYIDKAIEMGAILVVGQKDIIDCDVPYIKVENSRQSLAYLAAAYYDNPAKKMVMIGITGTDGKTTTTNLIFSILLTAGIKAGMISTLSAVIGDKVLDTGFHVTTPDAPEVQRLLSMMVDEGITHVVLETTSHGWEQYRVDACEFDIGVITNITHEHLDQHGSFNNYRAAKARLFTSLIDAHKKKLNDIRLAVLNRDDSSYEYLNAIPNLRTISYAIDSEADIFAKDIRFFNEGSEYNINFLANREIKVKSNLVGEFNILNCLAAFSTGVVGLGIDPDVVVKGINAIEGVPGRMERINCGQDFIAIVDFAHTPNALKVALETARKMTKGRVITVVGSAGLRDRQKRKLMAGTSISLADISIFTAEDPRTESLEMILNEMADGANLQNGVLGINYWCIRDRGNAIRQAIKIARPDDLIICCGKGHEQSMCFGTKEYAWDDRTALRAAISESLRINGPRMPFLPTQDGFE
ncbi:MAG: UDP-N-acetylmuramoyl-L-alanyl-D-glutamate--2,6-diaminopimelate ligase [Chloroflexota bacterium]